MNKLQQNLPACFVDFFKFQRDCETDLPKSGLFFNNLPGISRDVVAKWADAAKHANAQEFANAALFRAIAMLSQKLRAKILGAGIEPISHIETHNACTFAPGIACPGGWRGMRYMMRRLSSKYMSFEVKHVTIKTVEAANVVLAIRGANNEVLWTKNVQTQGGVPHNVIVHQKFKTGALNIGFDQTGINVYQANCANTGGCSTCGGNAGYTGDIIATGWDATFTGAEKKNSYGYGVTACVSITCDLDNILCMHRDALAWSLLYATGIQMILEAQASRRINPETVFGLSTAGETLNDWSGAMMQAMDVEMRAIMNSIKKDHVCFACCGNMPTYTNISS